MDDKTLLEVTKRFKKARQYTESHYKRTWANAFKSYNGIRTIRGYAGQADEFVPETFSIVEALVSSYVKTKPRFKYWPLHEEQEQSVEALNGLVNYYWSINNMTDKMISWIKDMALYGTGILAFSWLKDRPLIQNIPLNDFFVDPAARHINNPDEPGYPRYAGYRYLTSLEQLKSQMEVDVETGKVENRYKNLDKVTAANDGEEMDKDIKEMLIGSTYGKDAISEQVEVIDYWTEKKHVMIANRSVVILEEDNPYARKESTKELSMDLDGEIVPMKVKIPAIKGFLPFAVARNYVDTSLFYGKGIAEVILKTQELLNDTASQKRDNIAYVLNNMWQIEPRYQHLAERIQSAPGAIFPIPKGALTPIEKNDISPAADAEISRLTQQMRTAVAADAAVQGISQRYSRTTATEISNQMEQSDARTNVKMQSLEDGGLAQVGSILFKMIQLFVKEDTPVRMTDHNQITWQVYSPDVYFGEYQPKVVLESTADAEIAMLSQAMQTAAQFSLQNPLVNQEAFLRNMYKTLFSKYMTEDDINEMLTVPQPMMGPDGQPVDPSLVQSGASLAPGAEEYLLGGGSPQGGGDSFNKRAQTGNQGGGGANSNDNNIRRVRSEQASTRLR